MERRSLLIGGGVLLALLGGAIGAGLWVFYGGNYFDQGNERVFTVNRGESFISVVDSLEAQGIIRSRELFVFVAKVYGGTERIQAGKYGLVSGISNAELFQMLRSGKGNMLIHVTIPEGSRIRVQARLFARTLGIDSAAYARHAFDPSFAAALRIRQPSLEGYLLPDTYGFHWEQDERDILRRQVDNFRAFFADSLEQRAATFGWDVHTMLTFASIVEGEAVLDEERAIIAGVYHNRLRRGMKLEADPTIQYLLPDGPRRVLYSDLKADNPYNTYRYPGLPPGPVNNPGRASILASLYPVRHDYLFFVANGKGGHWFTRTYDDHLRYVRLFKRFRMRHTNNG
ncbi:MAG: endolytic transglycosylase MltG [Bacteroidota bacterium]